MASSISLIMMDHGIRLHKNRGSDPPQDEQQRQEILPEDWLPDGFWELDYVEPEAAADEPAVAEDRPAAVGYEGIEDAPDDRI